MSNAGDWKEYEKEVEDQFRESYPSARITANAKLLGKFSKVDRQIDLLIEEQASDFSFRIIVDAKRRGRKIDVGDVEAFLGMVRDVEAHTGVMVALEGYTHAALNRVHHDDIDVILDVLNLDELRVFQGFGAIPYAGRCGAATAAPFGWVIDADRRQGMLASLYQRGLTIEEAQKRHEWMYINFWNKEDKRVGSLDALLKYQENYLRQSFPDAEIDYLEGARGQKTGARTIIRRMRNKSYPVREYTGFVDFEEFIFMCVLFSPEELEKKNLRKLRFVLKEAFPMKVQHDHTALIANARTRLQAPLSAGEKSGLLSQIGFWQREMGHLEDARQCLEESIAAVPTNYAAVKDLLRVLFALDDKVEALKVLGHLLRLDPRNPTVFNDCFEFLADSPIYWGASISSSELLDLIEKLRSESAGDQFVQANCDFYAGNLLANVDPASARRRFTVALRSFRRLLPRHHEVFTRVRAVLRRLPGPRQANAPSE